MEDQQQPDETDSVLLHEWLDFPIDVTVWVLEETSDVLECSPFLGHVARLSCGSNELSKVTVCLLSKGSTYLKCLERSDYAYLPIISALSLMLGTPNMRP